VYAEALRMQVDGRSADPAAEVLAKGSSSRDLMASLLRLVATVGRPEHVAVLRPLCHVDDEVVRAQALHALGKLSDERELPTLWAATRDESPGAALHAARGVREAGGLEELRRVAETDGELARLAGQVLLEEED
ncbi:MAG: HEAT repeat domain-containing protein, partial [Gemmatimonadetes bacterium]|nr:HEAT repeat domain-containing protein [Gemmatimonadota bacterium]